MTLPPITVETLSPTRPQKPVAVPAAAKRKQDSPEDIRRACGEFEEIFLRMILKEANVARSLGNEEDSGAKLYGDLLVETLAKSVAQGGGLGIGEMLYREFTADKLDTVEKSKSAEER